MSFALTAGLDEEFVRESILPQKKEDLSSGRSL